MDVCISYKDAAERQIPKPDNLSILTAEEIGALLDELTEQDRVLHTYYLLEEDRSLLSDDVPFEGLIQTIRESGKTPVMLVTAQLDLTQDYVFKKYLTTLDNVEKAGFGTDADVRHEANRLRAQHKAHDAHALPKSRRYNW